MCTDDENESVTCLAVLTQITSMTDRWTYTQTEIVMVHTVTECHGVNLTATKIMRTSVPKAVHYW